MLAYIHTYIHTFMQKERKKERKIEGRMEGHTNFIVAFHNFDNSPINQFRKLIFFLYQRNTVQRSSFLSY
jgi:hypothetical protein